MDQQVLVAVVLGLTGLWPAHSYRRNIRQKTSERLPRPHVIVAGLRLDEARMRANTDLTAGAVMSEAVMLGLGAHVGRQVAHAVVAEAARTAADTGVRFGEALAADPRCGSPPGGELGATRRR